MKRTMLILAVVLVMAALVVASAGTALARFSPAACNQGTMNAHGSIPDLLPSSNEETPGHHHVPECEKD